MVRWEAHNGFSEVLKWCEENRDTKAWIDLTLYVDEPLTISQIKELKEIRPNIINIRPVLKNGLELNYKPVNRINLPVEELFRDFYRKGYQTEPGSELTRLFLELLDEDKEGEAI